MVVLGEGDVDYVLVGQLVLLTEEGVLGFVSLMTSGHPLLLADETLLLTRLSRLFLVTVGIVHFVVVVNLLVDVGSRVILGGLSLLPFELGTPEAMDDLADGALEPPSYADLLGGELGGLAEDVELDLLLTLHVLVVLLDHD